jgi:phosphoglycolate phosphatase-like HAD superfamily hydrolase
VIRKISAAASSIMVTVIPAPVPTVAVCWDVDGTLLLGGTIGTEVLGEAFEQVTGHPARFDAIRMGGHTDWLIGEALRDALPAEHAEAVTARGEAFGHDMIAAVTDGWHRRGGDLAAVAHTLPGVPETVAALAAEPGVVQTLTTGNVRVGARAKLTAVGLADGPIDLDLGGYGEGPGARVRVVEQARDALTRRYGAAPALVVVGDTPRDVEAAHRAGAVAVGVATGRSSADELRDAGAEHVFDDLADPGRLVAVVRATGEDRHAAEAGR